MAAGATDTGAGEALPPKPAVETDDKDAEDEIFIHIPDKDKVSQNKDVGLAHIMACDPLWGQGPFWGVGGLAPDKRSSPILKREASYSITLRTSCVPNSKNSWKQMKAKSACMLSGTRF